MEVNRLPVLSIFRLQWLLRELDKEEFWAFKKTLRERYVELSHHMLPQAELELAGPERLAFLLHEYYEKPVAWVITSNILEDMDLLALAQEARQEMRREAQDENSGYKDHVLTIFTQELDGHPEANPTEGLDMQALAGAFDPDQKGFRPSIVVLQAPSGPAGRALSRRILRCWAQGALYCDLFSYVFLLSAGELRGMKEQSLVELMARNWPNHQVPKAKIMSQPQRLLFIVDGLEELGTAWCHEQARLCADSTERQPMAALMYSLLRKALLPASSILIITTDEGVQQLKAVVASPRYLVVRGLSMEGGAELEDLTADRVEALVSGFMLTGSWLLSWHQASLVCRLLCAALRLPGAQGAWMQGLAGHSLTGFYLTYLLHQVAPGRPCLGQREQVTLWGLCSLAAYGLWGGKTLFHRRHLRAHRLRKVTVEALVRSGLLLRQDAGYTFPNPSLQGFCAALFYILVGSGGWPFGPRGHVRPELDLRPSSLSPLLLWVKHFLFGFLSPPVACALRTRLGLLACEELRHLLQHWISLLGRQGSAAPADVLDAFHCLFQTQDEAFVCGALSGFQDVRLPVSHWMDLLVSSFCLQSCPALSSLQIDVRDLFFPEKLQELGPAGPPGLAVKAVLEEQWEHLCSVLSTHPSLRRLHLGSSVLNEWAMKTLCERLRQPSCGVQALILKNAEISSSLQHLWIILATNQNLKHIYLASTLLRDKDVEAACEALRHPNCSLTSLQLDSCELSHAGYQMLSQALSAPISLTSLSLARNKMTDQILQHFCDALKNPQCSLRRLILDSCGLTDTSSQLLASALMSNPSLTHLCLSNNNLGADRLSLLCLLRLPSCALQRLVLNHCHLGVTSCGFLAFILLNNSSLTHLSLSMNPLQDSGLQLLCEALQGPSCRLQGLEVASCNLTSASCKSLARVLGQSKHLRSLDLATNALGDSGVATLCEGLKAEHGSLRRLGLEACGLTSDCCAMLSSTLSRNKNLTSLNLLRNDFSPLGVTMLCSAFAHPLCGLQVIGLWKQQYPKPVRKLLEETQQQKPQLEFRGDWYSLEEDDRLWWKR
ncbi:NACHT, LRR and PYD domains-containing protein 5 [Perognathus longimembris pacificus]|uniref:NACHT, LRR and PYD domains-containing protein 5 n=1 Tax=Perognathus longimembris pacificus TaxID=214514 RepID=UPI0020190198|nr:NACHT, LRR and PYD domains-containing protein 5 [Perognathus longimembris pacificus]